MYDKQELNGIETENKERCELEQREVAFQGVLSEKHNSGRVKADTRSRDKPCPKFVNEATAFYRSSRHIPERFNLVF